MNVIVGIVTFNPEIHVLQECLKASHGICSKAIVVDNGSDNIDQIKKCISRYDHFVENHENLGIARALNQIFEYADVMGYKWVLTLDQDTNVPENILSEYDRIIGSSKKNIAVVCPRINDVNSGKTWPEFSEREEYRFVDRCITSGSLTSLSAWKKVGRFDEYLFIDEVDHDFCFRLVKCGFNICMAREVIIRHQIGNTEIKRIFGKEIRVRNHSAFRKYYICRNILYISKKHYTKITFSALLHVIAFTGKTLFFESNKIEKLAACVRGIKDGIKG